MAKSLSGWYWHLGLASFIGMSGAIATSFNCALAQITPDSTLPNNSIVTPQGNTSIIEDGTQEGRNLFHSFEQFSVPTGGEAFFNNAADIQNILTRVTGGSVSNIDGLLRANGTANLFLLNPSGIIFGPNATLNIGGSFVGSTASSLNFADGTQFSATAPQSTPLLTISVPIGLQYGGTAGSILDQSQATNSSGQPVGLRVLPGQTLALLGGNVSLDGGILQAPGGRVELGGLAEAGTVGLSFDDNNLRSSFPLGVARADVSLQNASNVDVRASGGGSIAVNARNLDVLGGSKLFAGIEEGLLSVGSKAGSVTLNATDAITLGQASEIQNRVNRQAIGDSGDINVTAGSLSITDGAFLSASTFGRGNAGNVNVNVLDAVTLSGVSKDTGISSRIASTISDGAVGNGGTITIKTGSLSILDGALVNTSISPSPDNILPGGRGTAGNVNIDVSGPVTIARDSSRITSTVGSGAVGNGGTITIKAGSLSILDGAYLNTRIFPSPDNILPGGRGTGGNVNIDVSGPVTIARDSSRITSTVGSGAEGNGGSIIINAGSLSLDDALVYNDISGQGNAGSISVQASGEVSVANSLISSDVNSGAVGKGGNIDIQARSLSLTDGALVSTNTYGQGNAGSISVRASDEVSVANSLISSDVNSGAVGKGGNIDIQGRSLSLTDDASLGTGTSGQGDAGSVLIQASDSVSIVNSSILNLNSGDFDADGEGAVGKAGDINILTGSLSGDDAKLTTSTNGLGNAGSVLIRASGPVSFTSGSAISSAVTPTGVGNGGVINIVAESFSLNNAIVYTSTLGQGNAGSVFVQASDLVSVSLANSFISSSVEPRAGGNGGDINITTGSLSVTDGARLNTSSRGNGAAGNIKVAADSIRLFDQATLSSNTTAGQGNIELRSGDLVLRRGSNITTNAGGTATGGNITINTDVLAAIENSDISANSRNARGGRVTINTSGIFGTEYRDQLTPLSDITATGGSPELSGSVEINRLDVDPTQGLVELPAEVVDASNQIAQACPSGVREGKSKFIVTGRGGLPPSPHSPLTGEHVLTNLATLDTEVENISSADEGATNPTQVSAATTIVEATGWMFNKRGQVVLTATAPTAINIPWLPKSNCNAPKPSSDS